MASLGTKNKLGRFFQFQHNLRLSIKRLANFIWAIL